MKKILLVEDDNNLREIYGARLLAEGYDIVSAKDGEEALTMAVSEKPDLIISDIMMPKISGFDMLDILRATPQTKATKVIMMTALSQAEDRERGERLGADRYLVKSQVTLEDVVKVVKEVLDSEGRPVAGAAPAPAAAPAPTPAAPAPVAAPAAPTPLAPAAAAPAASPVPAPPSAPISPGSSISPTMPNAAAAPAAPVSISPGSGSDDTPSNDQQPPTPPPPVVPQPPAPPASPPSGGMPTPPTSPPASAVTVSQPPVAPTPPTPPQKTAVSSAMAHKPSSDKDKLEPPGRRHKVINPVHDLSNTGSNLNQLLNEEIQRGASPSGQVVAPSPNQTPSSTTAINQTANDEQALQDLLNQAAAAPATNQSTTGTPPAQSATPPGEVTPQIQDFMKNETPAAPQSGQTPPAAPTV